ncbi:MAG: porin family protein [Flavobacterium sp.]|nr:MAG: porin family protein [Flavobacterium sp.]
MRKVILIVLVLFAAHSQAQSFGIKAGVNFADLRGSDARGYGSITSFHVGIVREISLFNAVSLQPELLFSTQGAERGSDELKLNYFTLPLILKIYVSELSLEAGPQMGLLVGKSKDFDGDINTFDFGWAAGIGYEITGSLFAQARYNWSAVSVVDDAQIKNSVFQLSLGYMF